MVCASQLAVVIEDARKAGMSPDNPRLQAAEQNLATRYSEVKELADVAEKLGLQFQHSDEDEDLAQDLVQQVSLLRVAV